MNGHWQHPPHQQVSVVLSRIFFFFEIVIFRNLTNSAFLRSSNDITWKFIEASGKNFILSFFLSYLRILGYIVYFERNIAIG